jgi:hypothetical protein
MPVIVVTRLRLRDPALLDEFFTDAVAAIEQAMKSEGNLGTDAPPTRTTPGGGPQVCPQGGPAPHGHADDQGAGKGAA